MSLAIPTPTLMVKDVPGKRLPAGKAITIGCGRVAYADGSALTPVNASRFGFLVHRKLASGALEAWNAAEARWQTDTPEPEPLAFVDDAWQAILVPLGQLDADGRARFASDLASGYPEYHVRCTFAGTDAAGTARSGRSAASRTVTIHEAGALDRAGLAMTPPDAASAGAIGLYLKTSSLATRAGVIELREAGSGHEIVLEVSGARLRVSRDGDIELSPASGRAVRVAGDLDVSGGVVRVNGSVVH